MSNRRPARPRARAQDALATFVLPDAHAANPAREDNENLLRAARLRRVLVDEAARGATREERRRIARATRGGGLVEVGSE